jgi:hypothetical protein
LLVTGTVLVGDDVVLSAGELRGSGAGTLQVVDAFSCTNTFVANPPILRVAGSWSTDAYFAPTSGLVAFVGTLPQTLSSPTGSLRFQQVEVANGANVVTAVPMALGATLLVNGSLTTTASLDVEGTVTTNTESTLALGAATHRFAGSLSIGGVLTATGVFELDNTLDTSITAAVPIPAVRKTGAGAVTLAAGVRVAGNLESERGRFRYGNNVVVVGSAIFRGGDIDSGGSLEVQGSVSFLGATATSPGTIRCAGNWASVSNFTPPTGRVELTGTGTITSLTPNAAASFNLLDVLSGVRTVTGAIEVRGASMLVQSQATLRVDTGGRLSVERAAVTVNGSLEVTGTGELLLGDLTTVSVEPIGSCRLLGANPTATARVAGLDGGNYSFVVRGFLAARDFEFLQPDANGLDIRATATIDTTPAAGFRNGTFDFPRNEPNACLLRIEPPTNPPVTLNLQNLRFQNTQGVENVFNVRVPQGGQPVNLLNATGAFAGATFEDDPQNRINWTSGQLTVLGGFQVVAGLNSATVSWTTVDESAVHAFTLERQIVSPTPTAFGNPLVFPGLGVPTTRQQTVNGLVPGFTYRFRLLEQGVPAGPLTTIATADVTPFGSTAVAQVFEVGGPGFATIQQGVNAALASGLAAPVVRIRPGTYAPFTINGAPSRGLRVVGNGAGPVLISTAAATPVTVQNVPFGRYVELAELTIGSPASPVTGVLVNACAGMVVLDEVSVQSGAANAVVVQGSGSFVLQGPNTAVQSLGGRGVVLDGSSATMSNSTLSSLRLQNGSQLTHAALSVQPELLSGSTAVAFAGRMPSLETSRFPVLSAPLQFLFEGFPSSLWILVMSDAYLVPLNVFQMPILIDLASLTTITTAVTDVAGVATYSTFLPANGALIGATQVFQAASLDLFTGNFRLSDAASVLVVATN